MIVVLMLYVPSIQKRATQWATTQLSHQTGIEIEIQELHLQFPLRLRVVGIHLGRLANIECVTTDIRLRPLLQGIIEANHVIVKDINIHPDTLTQTNISVAYFRADDISYDWHKKHAHIQQLHLANGNAMLYERAVPTTSRTPLKRLPLSLTISNAELTHIETSYNSTKVQLQSSAETITLHEVGADTAMNLSLQNCKIAEGSFRLNNPQFTTHCTQINIQTDSLHYSPTDIEAQITQLTFKESHGIDLQEGTISVAWNGETLSVPYFALHTEGSSLQGHLRTLGYGTGNPTAIDGNVDIRVGYRDALLLTKWSDAIPQKFIHLYPSETLSASVVLNGTTEQLQIRKCHVTLPTAFEVEINGSIQGFTTPQQRVAHCHIEAKTQDLDFLSAFTENATLQIPSNMTFRGDLDYAPDTLHTQCALTLKEGSATLEAGYRITSRAYTLQIMTDSLDIHQIMPNGKVGLITLQAYLTGYGLDYKQDNTSIHGTLQLHQLQLKEYTFSNASAQIIKKDERWYAHASYNDSLMQWNLTTAIRYTPDTIRTRFHAQIDNLNLRALQIADTNIRPALQCSATLTMEPGTHYSLQGKLSEIALRTNTQSVYPHPLDLRATLTPDTILLGIHSGDLTLMTSAHINGLPWQWNHPIEMSSHITHLQATLSAGSDNPISNYLSLMGIKYRNIHATIMDQKNAITSHLAVRDITAKGVKTDSINLNMHYTKNILLAQLQSGELSWDTPQIQLKGKANGTFVWKEAFVPDSLSGTLYLSNVRFVLPAYSLQLYTIDTLSIPLEYSRLTLNSLPLYAMGEQPLLLDGKITLFSNTPIAQIRLTARNTNLLQDNPTRETLLYGKAFINGNISLDGPFNALSLSGDLQLGPNSSIHYIYKNAILTASNQLDNVVTFVSFNADTTSLPKAKRMANRLAMDLALSIDPTAQLEVSLGASKQNNVSIQGGGMLNLQYDPTIGIRLLGRYTIEQGELNMNVPLLHVSNMTIRTGSSVTWEGNPLNPLLNIAAEDRIRASVTLDGSPQSVLFVAGVSFSDTMEKLNVQFTLAAPENASMQNTLATLSPEERGKLSVALLTTGLYLGEGGTGNLMNTAIMGILQSQIDNISRDAFRTIDVSVGIEPLPDGVSGVSTRTDYSFSIAKRLWNNRIRIIIGGSLTTSNERIEDEAVIDNISIEWRITPVGNQYLRFFYDKNFESILEGEIRETGVGYAYRRRF